MFALRQKPLERDQSKQKMTKNNLQMEMKNSSDYVLSQFTRGVPLSARTIQRRTGIKNKAVLGIAKTLINEGKLRRVHPDEVGYNKFRFPSEEQIISIENERRRKNGNVKTKDNKDNKDKKDDKDKKNRGKFKGLKQGKYPPIRRFHVFMLV